MSEQINNNLQNISQNGNYFSYDQNPQPINSNNKNNSTNDQQINNNNNNSNSNNPISVKVSNNSNFSNQSYQQNEFKIENYKKQSRAGLANLGDTSYLNAVLQLLGQIPELVEFYINRKNEFYLNENNEINGAIKNRPFSFVTYRLFLHLYPENLNEVEIYKPDSYLRILSHFNPIYSSTKSKNPNDLLIFILNKLDDEMKYKNIIVSNNDYYGKTINSEEQTIISQVLRWEKIIAQKCNQCKVLKNQLSFFNTFDLDISNTWKKNTGKKNEISINDCLDTYSTEKEVTSYCQDCQQYQKMLVQSKINSINKNIIFLLDRGDGINNELLNIKFKIEENIDLTKYILDEQSKKKFELAGIISIVPNNNNNKFVCDCKSPIDNKWYKFDDDNVEVSFEDTEKVIEENNEKKLIPYILYYKSVSV